MEFRLILGDQLNIKHSWFNEDDSDVIYGMFEMQQETAYVQHHIQKVVGFFASMRNFADGLEKLGKNVVYFKINCKENTQNLIDNLNLIFENYSISKFSFIEPDEYRLQEQLLDFSNNLEIPFKVYSADHFLVTKSEIKTQFEGKKNHLMEYFYRNIRKKYHILIDENQKPEGGKWNYDHSNRKKWKGSPEIPSDYSNNETSRLREVLKDIQLAKIDTIGELDIKNFNYPTNRKNALKQLDLFLKEKLAYFGEYQDAMTTEDDNLFHSKISFALNTKMLHPLEVVNKSLEEYRKNPEIEINQVEGFIRQIIGWREYIRAIYWTYMPEYKSLNFFGFKNKLPDFYWTGNTKMNCAKNAIKNSLNNAYAHHIQRLMITGNLGLLLNVSPEELDNWYLGIYADAIEWVQLPNTRGMSQFADGGIVGTKPYVSSGSYINKMSDYCSKCYYNNKEKTSEKACPFNSLYWHFIITQEDKFKNNPRMKMMLSLANKLTPENKNKLLDRAEHIINNPDNY